MLGKFAQYLLSSVFRIHKGEELRAGCMLLYSVAAVGGVIITGQLASRALFLSALPQSAVPFKFILPPLALMVVSALYTRAAGRFRADRLIVASYSLILVGVVGFRLLLASPWRDSFAALSALFVYFDIASSLVIFQFWTFAGEIFNAREAKRLFGLISGGSTISNVLFGAFVSSIATRVAPENLLFIVMGSLLVCVACVLILARHYSTVLEEANEPAAEQQADSFSLWDDVRRVVRSPLVRSMSGILILVALVSSIGDYQLDLGLQLRYGSDSQGMVGFLGRFRLWAGVGAGLLQFFLAGRLLERFGVTAALLLLPLSMGFGAGAILLTGGLLWAVAMPRACDVIFKYPVNDPAFNLLYLPVDARLRAKARAILDGIIKPPMVTLLGLAFLWTGQRGSATIVHWAYLALALVGVWGILVLRTGWQYVVALSQSIRLHRLNPERESIDLADENSIRVIRETLHAPEAPRVIHALTLLPRIPRVDWTSQVVSLLDHPAPEVRLLALRFLSTQQAAIYAEEVVARFHDPVEEVRAAAIETLCALGKQRVFQRVLPFLQDPSPRIRGATVLGLIRYSGLDGFLHAGEQLKSLLDDPQPPARLEGVRVLEALQVPSFYHPLIPLLDDESIEVQVGAIRAATKIGAPELIPYLVPKLIHPLTCCYAIEALVRCVGQDLSRIEALLQEKGRHPAIRRYLLHVLRHQRSPAAVQLLLDQLASDDDRLRSIAYQVLMELRDHRQSVNPRPLRAALHYELRHTYELHLIHHDLRRFHPLLEETLTHRLHQAENRILGLLDLLYPELSYTWLRQSLDKRQTRLRATAVELIDNVVDRQLSELIVPLFSGTAEERLEVAAEKLQLSHQPQRERLRQLAGSTDDWLRTCALHAIGEHRLETLGEVVIEALDDADPLVRQTAQATYRRIYGVPQPAAVELSILEIQFPEDLSPQPNSGDPPMALSPLEKVFFLKGVPLFEQIPGEDIVGMVSIIHEVEIEKGETFIKKGEEGDCLYIVVAGEVLVRSEEIDEVLVRSREVIGERSVLTEQPRSADCQARTDVVALRIDKSDFWKLMEEQPKISIEILKVVVARYL